MDLQIEMIAQCLKSHDMLKNSLHTGTLYLWT